MATRPTNSSDSDTGSGRSRKGYTPPKGRPTARNVRSATRTGLSSTTEWIIVVIVFLAVLAVIFYFGRDFSSGVGGNSGSAPLSLVVSHILTG